MTSSAISEARKQTLQTRMGCGLTWSWSDRSWSEPSRVWSVQCIVGVSCVLLSGWIVLFFWCIASRLARRTLVELLTLAACCYAASDKSWHLVPGSLHLPACLVIVTPTAQLPLHWIHSGRIAWPCWSKAFGSRGLRQTTHQGQLVGVEGYSRKTLGLRFGHVDAACALVSNGFAKSQDQPATLCGLAVSWRRSF